MDRITLSSDEQRHNFGVRGQAYFTAAQSTDGYIQNADGQPNKANIRGLKTFVAPLPSSMTSAPNRNTDPSKHKPVTTDTVNLSNEATKNDPSLLDRVTHFAKAWGANP